MATDLGEGQMKTGGPSVRTDGGQQNTVLSSAVRQQLGNKMGASKLSEGSLSQEEETKSVSFSLRHHPDD